MSFLPQLWALVHMGKVLGYRLAGQEELGSSLESEGCH